MYTLLAALLILTAQDAKRPEFEVASIKPSAPDARGMWIRNSPGGRVNITNMTLKELIVIAWRIQPYQISGGPPWLDSLHYDISAKAENTLKQGEFPLLLQSLLEDRFQLTIRRETKELPIYALVLARKDGKLGPKLTESTESGCTTPDPTKPPAPPEPGQRYCGNMMMSPRSLTAVSLPVADIIPMLARTLGRTIVDKTGLTGKFDIGLEWTPDENQLSMMPADAPRPPVDSAGPSIFTALQEQLGLKLESQKGPVEIFVIDRAEKPSAN
ncbi:MAG: TIGR03435 family protein [Bryobacteraceae bacterium]